MKSDWRAKLPSYARSACGVPAEPVLNRYSELSGEVEDGESVADVAGAADSFHVLVDRHGHAGRGDGSAGRGMYFMTRPLARSSSRTSCALPCGSARKFTAGSANSPGV